MTPSVNRRSYDSARRRSASDATRQRILDAARGLLESNGYRGTKVSDIATAAGTSVDTVYELVGRKPVVLRELIERAISGTDRAVTAEERDYVRAIRDEPGATAKLAIYAAAVRDIHGRLAPLLVALKDASATEPEADAVWRDIAERRAANMAMFAEDLASTGRLRADRSISDVADTLWSLCSPEMYLLMTGDRGWTPGRYEGWLRDGLSRILLDGLSDPSSAVRASP